MEKLEKDQKVGENVSQAGQTATATTTNAPKNNRSSATTTTTARPPPTPPARALSREDVDNGITKVTTQCEEAVSKVILKSIPSESQITFVRFEGPNIALYTKNPKFALTELTYFLSSLSKTLKKRFIIRTDPSSRLPEDQTRQAVVK